MGNWLNVLSITVFLSLLIHSGQGARQGQDIKCGACRALVDEMEWAISQVPLARSEGHLLELMEEVCEKMKDYGERTDPSSNRNIYVRVTSRDGKVMDLSETTLDSRVTSSLKYACETIVEQHEDELIEFFAHETDNVKDKLCSRRTDLCDHALHMPHDEL
ncbi:protein canopy homolog 2 isoform X2 [Megalops cyprinoides]|uniref:protein canopy homolog 2 isoform X2 n=1 Tax=Megalops cyprinoides TaxID=118141 RepID=UPI001863ABFA|nr:protein canopy homolog 2 isoform X2 [Megalops cyprinoides]